MSDEATHDNAPITLSDTVKYGTVLAAIIAACVTGAVTWNSTTNRVHDLEGAVAELKSENAARKSEVAAVTKQLRDISGKLDLLLCSKDPANCSRRLQLILSDVDVDK